jgi:hypothetical protein
MGNNRPPVRQFAVGEEAFVAAQDAPGEEFWKVQGYSIWNPV